MPSNCDENFDDLSVNYMRDYDTKDCKWGATFYLKDMSSQQVVDAINEAYSNKVFVVGSRNPYIGVSNSGLEIQMYINNNGKIISAFPKE